MKDSVLQHVLLDKYVTFYVKYTSWIFDKIQSDRRDLILSLTFTNIPLVLHFVVLLSSVLSVSHFVSHSLTGVANVARLAAVAALLLVETPRSLPWRELGGAKLHGSTQQPLGEKVRRS